MELFLYIHYSKESNFVGEMTIIIVNEMKAAFIVLVHGFKTWQENQDKLEHF